MKLPRINFGLTLDHPLIQGLFRTITVFVFLFFYKLMKYHLEIGVEDSICTKPLPSVSFIFILFRKHNILASKKNKGFHHICYSV